MYPNTKKSWSCLTQEAPGRCHVAIPSKRVIYFHSYQVQGPQNEDLAARRGACGVGRLGRKGHRRRQNGACGRSGRTVPALPKDET